MSLVVIKYGGSLLEEPGHRSVFLKDVAELSKAEKVVLVHGGGKEISRQMEKAGLKPRFVNGRRCTDEATMQLVEAVLGSLNREIVAELQKNGARAEGFSGRHHHLAEGEAIAELGRVGQNLKIDIHGFKELLAGVPLPVFYSVAEDAKREPLNINADDFALALALACFADRLIFLTDTGGVRDGAGQLISKISPKDADSLAEKQVVTGGMLVKVKACIDAVKQGVRSVDIVKGIGYLLDPARMKPEGTLFNNGH